MCICVYIYVYNYLEPFDDPCFAWILGLAALGVYYVCIYIYQLMVGRVWNDSGIYLMNSFAFSRRAKELTRVFLHHRILSYVQRIVGTHEHRLDNPK